MTLPDLRFFSPKKISQTRAHGNGGITKWGFLKWWYSTTMGFPTKQDHFGVFSGYHHLRKHPNNNSQIYPNTKDPSSWCGHGTFLSYRCKVGPLPFVSSSGSNAHSYQLVSSYDRLWACLLGGWMAGKSAVMSLVR